jgi:hypothetical protein
MQNRTRTVASAVFAVFLVISMAQPCSVARAADGCLNEPKQQTPAGAHWYYRIDHASHRKCWYLADENQKASQTVSPQPSSSPPASPSPASPTPPAPRTASTIQTIQKSNADAHAELQLAKTPAEPPHAVSPVAPPKPEFGANVFAAASPPPAPPPARDQSSAARSGDSEPGVTRAMSIGTTDEPSGSQMRAEVTGSIAGAAPATGPDAEDTSDSSLRTLLALLLITLGLSIIAISLIFKPSAMTLAGRH